ncbi:MAG TPA: type II toxin-antitoxin system prevent-host-death family antitoxin [Gemmatimonadaceae bacterium]|jgi:prevent-host-death family protein
MAKSKHKPSVKPPPTRKSLAVAEPMPASSLRASRAVEVPAGVFKNTCLSLMDDVRSGHKEIIITKHGEPVAKLVAPDAVSATGFGFLRGTVLEHGDLVTPDHEAWGDLA